MICSLILHSIKKNTCPNWLIMPALEICTARNKIMGHPPPKDPDLQWYFAPPKLVPVWLIICCQSVLPAPRNEPSPRLLIPQAFNRPVAHAVRPTWPKNLPISFPTAFVSQLLHMQQVIIQSERNISKRKWIGLILNFLKKLNYTV